LTERDEDGMAIRYCIVEGGVPGLDDYTARASVSRQGEGCEIRWECQALTDEESTSQHQAVLDGLARAMVGVFASQFE
jgi:hypothetical protein